MTARGGGPSCRTAKRPRRRAAGETWRRTEWQKADKPTDVIRALSNAIRVIKSGQHDPLQAHERVKDMYAWSDVARRTELVYERAMAAPRKDTFERLTRYDSPPLPLILLARGRASVLGRIRADRPLTRLLSLGPVFGPILCCIMAVQHWFFWFLEWYDPRDEIEYVDDIWSSGQFRKVGFGQTWRGVVADEGAGSASRATEYTRMAMT